MAYTVKKLSEMSGVTVRTLHFYEEIDLLKPAYYGSNGYRYYEEKELLQLQQILLFKELGFSLKQLQKVLGRSDFDKLSALHSHRKALTQEWEKVEQLIKTVDNTINHLKGKKKMEDQEMYYGFITKEKQAEYDKYLKNRLGPEDTTMDECKKNIKHWTKADWEKYQQESDSNMKEAVKLMEKQYSITSSEVQMVIGKLYEWIKKCWTPNRKSFTALGQMYLGFEWKPFFSKYDPDHPRLAKFVAEGMKEFADRNLS